MMRKDLKYYLLSLPDLPIPVWYQNTSCRKEYSPLFGLLTNNLDLLRLLHVSAALAQQNDLQPGSPERAILTLDDGSTIVLEQTKDGKLASQGNSEIIKKNGQIEYNNSKALKKSNEVLYNTVTTPPKFFAFNTPSLQTIINQPQQG